MNAESELVTEIVEDFESEEQEPNDCEAAGSISQSTVELSVTAVYPPLKDPLLDEDLYDHEIFFPWLTDCVSWAEPLEDTDWFASFSV